MVAGTKQSLAYSSIYLFVLLLPPACMLLQFFLRLCAELQLITLALRSRTGHGAAIGLLSPCDSDESSVLRLKLKLVDLGSGSM